MHPRRRPTLPPTPQPPPASLFPSPRAYLHLLLLSSFLTISLQNPLLADPVSTTTITTAAAPTEEIQATLKRLKVAPGLQVQLWAAEPLVRNITSIAFDDHGRAYVVETGRRRTSVFDIRNLQAWLDHDYALLTVQDRIQFLQSRLTPTNPDYPAFLNAVNKKGGLEDFNRDGTIDWHDLEVESERIQLVSDRNGDGIADTSETFADGFQSIVSGVAAGVLAQRNQVWFTCIPDLWKFPAPTAGQRLAHPITGKQLHTGFGVHIAFGGHDMHGLILGPDGRLYFSIADRGAHVPLPSGSHLINPDSGAIFRCSPDGSDLELYATGLRNPQELAFDAEGNLWTGDNNGDGGDKARWTRVVEGADYGWTMGWQWLPKMGAWNSERLWQLESTNTSLHILPPVAHIGHGPAGIAYYPGTGLPDRFLNHFLYADFPGGIRYFQVRAEGNRFVVDNPSPALEDNSLSNMDRKLLWDLSPVDVTFAPDGGAYVADWVQGWDKTGKGRIWKVFSLESQTNSLVRETARLLHEGFSFVSGPELQKLLGHPDQRVRLNAQWEMAARGSTSLAFFQELTSPTHPLIQRLHGIWGLGQLARERRSQRACSALATLLSDPQAHIRSHAARMLGDARSPLLIPALPSLFSDPHPQVPFHALWALASYLRNPSPIQLPESFPTLLAQQGLADPYIRHAAALALSRMTPTDLKNWTTQHSTSSEPGIRLCTLLALRRTVSPSSSIFLKDPHPAIQLEAARAIYDTPIEESLPALADLLNQNPSSTNSFPQGLPYSALEHQSFILRRAIQAAARVATPNSVSALLHISLESQHPESIRLEAIETLASWNNPPQRDRITGLTRPYPGKPSTPTTTSLASQALTDQWSSIQNHIQSLPPTSESVRIAWLNACSHLGVVAAVPSLREILESAPLHSTNTAPTLPYTPATRLAAWKALARLKHPQLEAIARRRTQDPDATIRRELSLWLAVQHAPQNWKDMKRALLEGSIPERQLAWTQILAFKDREPVLPASVASWVDLVRSNQAPAELTWDILQAARNLTSSHPSSSPLNAALVRWTNSLPKNSTIAAWKPLLHGGNPNTGKQIFLERQDLACLRCHKFHRNTEGGVVGPDLGPLMKSRGPDYILESILNPNATIAAGYENVTVALKNGTTATGVVKSETDTELVVESLEDGRVAIPKSDIQSRNRGQSAMPEGLVDLMTPQEFRDLLAFLCSDQ